MAKSKIQWHPLLGRLLRPRVEGYYDMQTNVPVGDLPRQADIVLLRRTGTAPPPFRGLWRHLTRWNAVEYKGPTVNPRHQHVPLLVEVGLGIYRRLSAASKMKGQPVPPAPEVSFWYVANRLKGGFLRAVGGLLGGLDTIDQGVWKGTVLGHPCMLVSTGELPLDEDSLPLHVLGLEPLRQQVAVGEFVIESAERFAIYGSTFAALHPAAWKELETMARTKRPTLKVDFRAALELVGLDNAIEQIGQEIRERGDEKKIIQLLGEKRVLEQMTVDDILKNLPPAKRRELLRRVNPKSGS